MVADKVTVVTRRAGLAKEHGVRWESDGGGEYTLEVVEKETRGTEVTLHLREGEDELANANRLRTIIRKYSDHITSPIVMKEEEWDKDNSRLPYTGKDRLSIRPARVGPRSKAKSPKSSTTSFISMWRTISKRRWLIPTTRSKASRNTRSSVYPRARAV